MKVHRIGIDLAKNVFQVCGVDEHEKPLFNKALRRAKFREFMTHVEPTLVGMESCGSAHYWARELRQMGHDVRLMAPHFVTPYRKNDKHDGNDADAVCEAVGRPNMRFVAIKSTEQQAVLVVHRARDRLMGSRTALINQIRGLLAEFGVTIDVGADKVRKALPAICEDADNALPSLAREIFTDLYDQLVDLDRRVAEYDRRIARLARDMPMASKLMAVPGVGPLVATAVVASVGDAQLFDNGRQLAAWLGLVPKKYGTGGQVRLGRITKRGDVYLRRLLVHGARSVVSRAAAKSDPTSCWVTEVRTRRGFNKAVVALAAKNARTLWALMAHDEDYRGGATASVAA